MCNAQPPVVLEKSASHSVLVVCKCACMYACFIHVLTSSVVLYVCLCVYVGLLVASYEAHVRVFVYVSKKCQYECCQLCIECASKDCGLARS